MLHCKYYVYQMRNEAKNFRWGLTVLADLTSKLNKR